MKKVILLVLMSFAIYAKAQSYLTLSEAKEIASTYYGAFQQMAKHPIGDLRNENEKRLFGVLGVDANGRALSGRLEVPNDLIEMDGKQDADNRPIQIRSYVTKFLRIVEEKKIDFSYKVLSNEYHQGPEIKKSNDTPLFARVVVQKTIKSPRFPMAQINDTVFINTESKSISLITNKYRRFSWSSIESMTIDELLAEAQNMYSNRRYDGAFKLYQKILEKDPRHAEASYRLGVMCFKGEGCKKYPKKVRDYLVEFYWQKSTNGISELVLNHHNFNVVIRSFSGRESDPFPSNRLFAYNYKLGKLGYISSQGKMVIKQQYVSGFPFFNNGTAIVMSDKNEWFLIDTMGTVKDVYVRVEAVEGGKQLLVHKEDKSGVINRKTGEWDVPLINRITACDVIGGETKRYYVCKDGKYGIVSSGNIAIIPIIFNSITRVRYREGTFLCDYDKYAYDQLLKKYEKSPPIPMDELRRIGTVWNSMPASTAGFTVVEVLGSDKEEWLLMDATGKVLDTFESFFWLKFPNHDERFCEFKKEEKRGLLWPDYRILLPAISNDTIWPLDIGENWVRFYYDRKEPAYGQLREKYGSADKIPEKELVKVVTILKVDIK